jgi:hypothetical protein
MACKSIQFLLHSCLNKVFTIYLLFFFNHFIFYRLEKSNMRCSCTISWKNLVGRKYESSAHLTYLYVYVGVHTRLYFQYRIALGQSKIRVIIKSRKWNRKAKWLKNTDWSTEKSDWSSMIHSDDNKSFWFLFGFLLLPLRFAWKLNVQSKIDLGQSLAAQKSSKIFFACFYMIR